MKRALQGFVLTVEWQCPSCASPLPVNGFTSRVHCRQCSAEHALDLKFWRAMFSAEKLGEAMALPPGKIRTLQRVGRPCAYSFGNAMPRCPSCRKFAPNAAQLTEAAERGGLTCPVCAAPIQVRPAGPIARELLPQARFVVGETLDAADARETEPLVFGCTKCGAALDVDGSTRTVPCEYCGVSSYLPDGLWAKLHPPVPITPFFLVAEFTASERMNARHQHVSGSLADARKHGLSAETYAALAADPNADVRIELARNPTVPPEVLEALAGDAASSVRSALAKSAALTPEVAALLVRDPDTTVKGHLAGNRRTPPDQLAILARVDATVSRVTLGLASNPALSPGDVVQLLGDHLDGHATAALLRRDPGDAVVHQLVRHRNRHVREEVATYPDLAPADVRRLARDGVVAVAEAARTHPRYEPGAGGGIRAALLVLAILVVIGVVVAYLVWLRR